MRMMPLTSTELFWQILEGMMRSLLRVTWRLLGMMKTKLRVKKKGAANQPTGPSKSTRF